MYKGLPETKGKGRLSEGCHVFLADIAIHVNEGRKETMNFFLEELLYHQLWGHGQIVSSDGYQLPIF